MAGEVVRQNGEVVQSNLFSGLDDALLLSEDDLHVRRRGRVALDPAVRLVDPPVPEGLGSVALDVGDDELLALHVRLDSGERVLDEFDEELAGLLRPAGGRAAALFALGVMRDALIVAEERDGALVLDNGLKICERLICSHALDGAANFKHRLEVNALLHSLGLQARGTWVICVRLSHLKRLGQTD